MSINQRHRVLAGIRVEFNDEKCVNYENVAQSLMSHLALLRLNLPVCRMAPAPFQVPARINASEAFSHSSKKTLIFKSTSGIRMLLEGSGIRGLEVLMEAESKVLVISSTNI